jgi:ABC-type metal ion transport system substrate-binding protein
MTLSDTSIFVPVKDLISVSSDSLSGRRALHILSDTGLIRGKYVVSGNEVSYDDAVTAKSEGEKVDISFVRAFSRNNTEPT